MAIPVFHVDAFAGRPFEGNPAAVCLLERPASESWMQAVAAEMNLSETAFVHPGEGEESAFRLRWFTPKVEVDLCGHATLAAAHVLWESERLSVDQTARFLTRSGELTCVYRGGWIEMDFPAATVNPATAPVQLIESLGVRPLAIARKTPFDYLLELESEAAVRAVRPDFGLLASVEARGVIVTSRSADPEYHFVSRFFAPAAGINEDPVTGSAHCALAVYWQPILNRTRFVARQISARGGTVRAELRGDRVILAGQAVSIAEGKIVTPGAGEK